MSFEAKPSLGFPGARIIGRERGPHKVKTYKSKWDGCGYKGPDGHEGRGRVEAHGNKAMQETCYRVYVTTRVEYKQRINSIILVLASIMKLRFFMISYYPPTQPT